MNEKDNKKTEHKKRVDRIIFIYHFYLLEYKSEDIIDMAMDLDKYTFDKEELKALEMFAKQREDLEKSISEKLKASWSWERVEPLVKAIFINGSLEIKNKINDKPIVINESLVIAEEYAYPNVKKLLNAVLDKID